MTTNQPDAGEIGSDDIGETFVVRFRDSVTSVELDDEAVLLDGATEAVHTLNPTGTLVWRCVDGVASLGEIIDDFAAVFVDVARDELAADILQLVRAMGAQGLLVGVRGTPEEEHQHGVEAAPADHHHAGGTDEH